MAKHATTSEFVDCPSADEMEDLWSRHSAAWRDTAQITSQWQDASAVDPLLLKQKVKGDFFAVLDALKITLLIGREYEHLLFGLSALDGEHVTYMPLPHPSGMAVDREKGIVHVASTRNPNQIYDLAPIVGGVDRLDVDAMECEDKPLVPVRSRFLPGCLYMHDLALIGGELYANAVGHNAVVHLSKEGRFTRKWWPKCIETEDGPAFGQNFIQLNSIAAGETLSQSFFSASSEKMSSRRPGHKNYPVDGRGVIFSGKTREPIARGLTRPHSARIEPGTKKIWVDNSGYGEVGLIEDGRFHTVTKLPGWTRGLAFCGGVAFVGTSRVIPKFSQYAPGLDVNASICAVHAIDIKSGKILGSVIWPYGNQIFAIEWLPRQQSGGFPYSIASPGSSPSRDCKTMFYTFSTDLQKD